MAEFSCYLRGEGGEHSKKTVTVRFTHNKKHFERASKARVLEKDFDDATGRVKIKVEDAAEQNRLIEVMRERFERAAQWCINAQPPLELNVENFRHMYLVLEPMLETLGKNERTISLTKSTIIEDLEAEIARKEAELEADRKRLVQLKNPNGINRKLVSTILSRYQELHKELSPLTRRGYLVTMRMFERVLMDDFRVDELDATVLCAVRDRLLEERKRNSTIKQHFTRLKTAIDLYVEEHEPEYDTKYLRKVKVGTPVKDKPIIYLNPKELKEVEDLEFSEPRLAYVRDLFLLSCFTGLRHVDLHISLDDVEDDYIQVLASKTQRQFALPFSTKANALMKRMRESGYDYNPQRVGNFSRLVKEVCSYAPSLARLRPVTLAKPVPGETVEKKPKWELMSSKAGRKTFINSCLLKNIRIEVVADWVGHTNLKMINNHYSHKRAQSEAERHKLEADLPENISTQ